MNHSETICFNVLTVGKEYSKAKSRAILAFNQSTLVIELTFDTRDAADAFFSASKEWAFLRLSEDKDAGDLVNCHLGKSATTNEPERKFQLCSNIDHESPHK